MSVEDFERLAQNLAKLAEVPSRCAKAASVGIAEAIDREFTEGTDPYAKSWRRLADSTLRRGRRPPPLTDTRKMRDSVEVKPMRGAGIQITLDETPAIFHQGGTSRGLPKRTILPDRGMPSRWAEVLEDEAERAFGDIMQGR